jgi:predicted site-specific integrase-resolvase
MKKAVYTFELNNEIKEDALLNSKELAKALSVSVQTIRRWHYIGYLRGLKIGTYVVRYRWGDVQAWIGEKQHRSQRGY